jgi:PAS domain S-box-containing protein
MENSKHKRLTSKGGGLEFSQEFFSHIYDNKRLREYLCLFDLLKEGILFLDRNFNILYANTFIGKLSGYRNNNIPGMNFMDLMSGVRNVNRNTALSNLKNKGVWNIETNFRNKSGTLKYVCLSFHFINNADVKPSVIFCVCTDTTELKTAIDLLNKRNNLLDLLNDVIKHTNRSMDLKSSITYAIDKVCRYTAWEIGHCYLLVNDALKSTGIWNSNFNRKYRSFKNYTEKESYIAEKGLPRKCLQRAKPILYDLNKLKNDFPFVRFDYIRKLGLKSGVWLPVLINKKVTGVIEFFSSSEIRSDNEILNGLKNICLELGNLKDRIETINGIKINEKLAALGRFSVGIAHEIRNPLANISALSQLLLKNENNDKKKQYLIYILENIQIANNTITDLLNNVSSEEVSLSKVNFRIFIDKILDKTKPRFAKRKIKVLKNISLNLPEIFIDEIKIENAIMNFLTNAMDSMPAGGNIKFKVLKLKQKDYITISITDCGIGIPEENMGKIFEPFFTTKHSGTGLGMGLALQAIKSHGGKLNIKSKPGTGTAIEIKIPVKKEITGE